MTRQMAEHEFTRIAFLCEALVSSPGCSSKLFDMFERDQLVAGVTMSTHASRVLDALVAAFESVDPTDIDGVRRVELMLGLRSDPYSRDASAILSGALNR